MPNQRSSGQKLLNLPVNEEFLAALDAGIDRLGYSNRSEFIREAIVEKLQHMGIQIPKHLIRVPSRKGKGGPVRYNVRSSSYIMNEEAVTQPHKMRPGLPAKAREAADALTKKALEKIEAHKPKE